MLLRRFVNGICAIPMHSIHSWETLNLINSEAKHQVLLQVNPGKSFENFPELLLLKKCMGAGQAGGVEMKGVESGVATSNLHSRTIPCFSAKGKTTTVIAS